MHAGAFGFAPPVVTAGRFGSAVANGDEPWRLPATWLQVAAAISAGLWAPLA